MASSRSARTRRTRAVASLAVALAVVASACGHSPPRATGHQRLRVAADPGAVDVTDTTCGAGWTAPTTGPTTFTVTNHAGSTIEVELEGLADHRVYARIETLAPNTVRPVSGQLSPGTYYWKCSYADGTARNSANTPVTGPNVPGRSFFPVGQDEMLIVAVTFRTSTSTGISTLVAATDALNNAAKVSSTTTAKLQSLWLTAHLDYGRLGGAYGLFGAFDDAIDGRPDGLPLGVSDPSWTGFLRLEYALWHAQSRTTINALTAKLSTSVHALQKAFPIENGNANELTIRAHEILENALQFELNAKTDEGSHTNLATLRANIDGTRTALAAITPPLTTRDPALLAKVTKDLDVVNATLARYHHSDGTWAPLSSLRKTQREQLDSQVDQALEDLSIIPDILELDKHADE